MVTKSIVEIGDIIACLPELSRHHAHATTTYRLLDNVARGAVAASGFTDAEGKPQPVGELGTIALPYTKMGAVDSLDLFGLDELIIFAFYWTNRTRYRSAADIGANLGLHSIVMNRCGWKVRAYEPDPEHAQRLERHLRLNGCDGVELVKAAVSAQPGELEFVRVLGNTTSSHLAGAKANAYGELERFPVRVESIAAIMPVADFVKVDAEGEEGKIILGTSKHDWDRTDMMVEIGSEPNAGAVFTHLTRLGVNAFAQKLGWGKVSSLAEMPTSYHDGSLFISRQGAMPWQE